MRKVARILAFQTNTDSKRRPQVKPGPSGCRILHFAPVRREVEINKGSGPAALSFPEAWRPFIRRVAQLEFEKRGLGSQNLSISGIPEGAIVVNNCTARIALSFSESARIEYA